MLLKYLISTLIVSVIIQSSFGNSDDKSIKDSDTELPCLSVGGTCMAADDCPEGRQTKVKGLCPVQQQKGYECCLSSRKTDKICRQRGGECVPKSSRCPEFLTFKEATDCAYDEKCCILV